MKSKFRKEIIFETDFRIPPKLSSLLIEIDSSQNCMHFLILDM
jgi:hypothetical protein